jgi:SAM-dependent methyltransferase
VTADAVIWHDLECGGYTADLPLWRELAATESGPVLDLGAGTGRVALDLARAGHEVWALDRDATLLEALEARGSGLPVRTVLADARSFALPERFGLVVAPMQTVQLLGAAGRSGCLRSVAAHLRPGGLFAAAVASRVEAYEGDPVLAPEPDRCVVGETRYASRPVAVRERDDGYVLERVREVAAPGRAPAATTDAIRLDRLDAEALGAEALDAGLVAEPERMIGATDDHVGSEVAMLRA